MATFFSLIGLLFKTIRQLLGVYLTPKVWMYICGIGLCFGGIYYVYHLKSNLNKAEAKIVTLTNEVKIANHNLDMKQQEITNLENKIRDIEKEVSKLAQAQEVSKTTLEELNKTNTKVVLKKDDLINVLNTDINNIRNSDLLNKPGEISKKRVKAIISAYTMVVTQ